MSYSIWMMLVNLCRQHIDKINAEMTIVMTARDKETINNHLRIIATELDLVTSILNNTNPKEDGHGHFGSH